MGGLRVKKKHIFDRWLSIVALMVAIVGIVLTIEGFMVDPQGEIHHSVLIYFGECLIFVGAVPIIELHTKEKEDKKTK